MKNRVTTEELYLESERDEVIKTEKLEEVNAGIYPAYYIREDDHLKVSNSVVNLILEKGSLNLNESFNPPKYFYQNKISHFYEKNIYPKISHIRGAARIKMTLEYFNPEDWYNTWDTIDEDIEKLEPFQTVTVDNVEKNFEPTYDLQKDELIEGVAEHLTSYINKIERKYPDHEHIILMGGKDSQLIGLVPKETLQLACLLC
jgi:hypothetical protein